MKGLEGKVLNIDKDNAVIMHQLLDMHMGDYTNFESKKSHNPEYVKHLSYVNEIISPNPNKQGNFKAFELREKINVVSEAYRVSNKILEENKACLFSPEYIIKYQTGGAEGANIKMANLSKKLEIKEFAHNEGYKGYNKTPNNFVIVSLDSKGESFFFILDIGNVIEFTKKRQVVQSIKFSVNDDVYLFTSEFRAKLDENDNIIEKHDHNLGYCPALQLSKQKFGHGKVVTSPFFGVINKLNQLWFWSNTGETSSMFAAHPYVWYVKNEEDADNNVYADNRNLGNSDIFATKEQYNNQTSKSEVDAGAAVQIGTVLNADGDKMVQPIDRLDANIDSVEFLDAKPNRIASSLIVELSGVIDKPTKMQLNAEQINTIRESRVTILLEQSKAVERIHRFIEITVQKEQNPQDFKALALDYGTKFTVLNRGHLLTNLSDAKETNQRPLTKKAVGAIIDFDNKDNPIEKEIETIKRLISPYYLTEQSLIDNWKDNNKITFIDWYIATNMDYLIDVYQSKYQHISELSDHNNSFQKAEFIKTQILNLIPKQDEQRTE